jgi:hypothetical protein
MPDLLFGHPRYQEPRQRRTSPRERNKHTAAILDIDDYHRRPGNPLDEAWDDFAAEALERAETKRASAEANAVTPLPDAGNLGQHFYMLSEAIFEHRPELLLSISFVFGFGAVAFCGYSLLVLISDGLFPLGKLVVSLILLTVAAGFFSLWRAVRSVLRDA